MPESRLGWGVLATGHIASVFTDDLRIAGLHVAAVGSRSDERAEAFARERDIPRAHGSWRALAEDPTVDVVYVATPPSAHAEAAMVALELGKHVLLEKPFTLNAAEAAAVIDLADRNGLVVLEAMWTRWLPHMREIHALIDDGAIGTPELLVADHLQALPSDPDHRLNRADLGGGALLDLGVYPVSFAHDLFGEPDTVLAAGEMTATGVDRRITGTLVHAGGRHTSFSTALDLAGPNRASIVGDGGRIDIDAVWYAPTSYSLRDRGGAVVRTSRPPVDGHGMQFQALEMERLVREGQAESPALPRAETLAVMRTLDRIRAAVGLVYPQESAG